MSKLKVTLISFSVVNDCCKLQRCLYPLLTLKVQGKIELNVAYISAIGIYAYSQDQLKDLVDSTDIFLLQRPNVETPLIALFIEKCLKLKSDLTFINEYDDYLLSELSPEKKYQHLEFIRKFPTIVSTMYLATIFKKLVPDSRLFLYKNRLPGKELPTPVFKRNTILHIGTSTHFNDLVLIQKVLRNVTDRGKKLIIWGNKVPEYIKNTKNVEQLHFVSDYEVYLNNLMDIPVSFGINPLAKTRKNWAKSGIKYIEFGLKGVPALFTDIPEYKEIVPKELLVTSTEWQEKIDEMLGKTVAQLRELGMYMREDVLENHMLTQEHVDSYYDILVQSRNLMRGID
jgi:hypothetical protein